MYINYVGMLRYVDVHLLACLQVQCSALSAAASVASVSGKRITEEC